MIPVRTVLPELGRSRSTGVPLVSIDRTAGPTWTDNNAVLTLAMMVVRKVGELIGWQTAM